MHAYLLTSQDKNLAEVKAKELVKKIAGAALEFSIQKIEDVRNLSNFLKLKVVSPTAILIKDSEKASIEALNAFLKNLEEPQKNVHFILTASSEYKILPTIVSRCQVIKLEIGDKRSLALRAWRLEIDKSIGEFINSTPPEKLSITDKFRKKEEAISFLESVILTLHETLHQGNADYKKVSQNLMLAGNTLVALKGNANVSLQLTNFVVNYQ